MMMTKWTFALALINTFAVASILFGTYLFRKTVRTRTANYLIAMLICVSVEIVGVTVALFVPSWVEMPLRFGMRLVEIVGVLSFVVYVMSNGNGVEAQKT
jgi:hypothetical protein